MGELDYMLKPCFCGGKRTIEYKVLEFDKVNRNGTIISKDAFKDQDSPDAEVLGTVELNLEPDGVYMSIGKEDYEKIMKLMEERNK